jgi:WD40 repeat protein
VGDLLALGFATDQLLLIEASTGRQLASLETEAGHVNHVAFSADGKWLFTAALDNRVRVYDVEHRRLLSTLRAHGDWVLSLAVSPDQKGLVSTSRDGTATVWGLAPRYRLPAQPSALESVAWSPDGKTIATGGNFGAVKLWNAQTGTALRGLVGCQGLVCDLNFSPDGKYLAAAGEDRLTRIWNLAAGEPSLILGGHTASVTCARFSPDGKKLVTTSTDGTVRLWDVAPRSAK